MQESDIFLLAQNNDLDELQKVLSSGDHDLVHSKNSHNFTLLHIAAKYNHFEVVEFLISQTNDINCKNVAGDTPLILAAMVGSKSIIKLLVDYGADGISYLT